MRAIPSLPRRRGIHPWALGIGLLVLLGDAVLIAASVLHRLVDAGGPLGFLTLGRWNGNRDGTFAGLWGGLQLLAAAAALVATALILRRGPGAARRSAPVHLAWAVVLLMIALDDYLMIHERVGSVLVHSLDLPEVFGLRAQDLGELLVWGLLAAALGVLLLLAHLRAPAEARWNSWGFVVLMVFLVAFGVVLDMLNILLHAVLGETLLTVTTHVETGGELVAMSLLLIRAAWILERKRTDADEGTGGEPAGLRRGPARHSRPVPAPAS